MTPTTGRLPMNFTGDQELRMRRSAVPAIYGAGMHPDRELWVNEPRDVEPATFVPSNRFRPGTEKAFN